MQEIQFNLSWEQAVEAMGNGKLVARGLWAEPVVLCLRPNDTITEDIVPNIKTLPLALKSYIQKTGKGAVHFTNAYCVYYTDSRTIDNGWTPLLEDKTATDWGIVGE